MVQELIQLTQQLIAIASINPQATGQTNTPYGESRITTFIIDWLAAQDLNAQLQPVTSDRANVLSVAQGTDATKTLLLCSHTDTVETTGYQGDPFDPELRNDRVHGRGACDDKGSLATMMIAYRNRVKQSPLPVNLAFLATCDEEYGMTGSRYFAKNLPIPLTAAIFGEPTGLQIITAHKGAMRLRLTTHGKAVHSSMPHLGQNAITTMAKAVQIVETFAADRASLPPHPKLGHDTLALTTINGGDQPNIIPDVCQAQIDWRFLPHQSPQQSRDQLAATLAEQLNCHIDLDILDIFNAMETDENHPIVKKFTNAASPITHTPKTGAVLYATDASSFTHLNIPTLIFGPGHITEAHTTSEYVQTNQLENALKIYTAFLNKL
ncbi:MAG: M20 family metallopeptidase [Phycisphaerae bacterium]|nr:M20 family metallopeptidase [Phycisphaerae bacterium]